MHRRNHPNLREEILRIAEEGFRENGYDATTFQIISDSLGITKGAITYHFKNKHMIVAEFIQLMFNDLRAFIDQYPDEILNVYHRFCIMYIYAYRIIMKTPRNQELFYHRDQMHQWQTGRVQTVYGIYSTIASAFGKDNSHESLLMKAYMDLGARKRMYQEYTENPYLLTLDKYCYYHIYLIGALSRLDESVLQESIDAAFTFANARTPTAVRLFGCSDG